MYTPVPLILAFFILVFASSGTQAQVGTKTSRPRTASTTKTTAHDATSEVTLRIEAGLVFRSGDVKPVARATFYLLDAHPGEILKAAGLKPLMGETTPDRLVLELIMAYRAGSSADPDLAEFLKRAIKALRPHIIEEVTTGFDGKGEFKPVKPGTYHLFSFTVTMGQSSAYWSVPVDLSSGRTRSVVLDNSNAEIW